MSHDPSTNPLVLEADRLHQMLAKCLTEHPGSTPLVELSACSYLLAGVAAEHIKRQEELEGRTMGHRELEAVLDNVFDIMRIQVQHHRRGLPTRQ